VTGPASGGRQFTAGRAAAAAFGLSVALLALGGLLGYMWGLGERAEEVRRLEERLAGRGEDRERLRELAVRLDSIERSYDRLRRAMSGEPAASERNVRLPGPPRGAAGAAVGAGAGDVEGGRALSWPLARAGFVTRLHRDVEPEADGHPGLDIAVPEGSYVRSVARGLVTEVGRDSVYGLFVRVRHPEGLASLYAHNGWSFVEVGDSVRAREVLALSGNSGRSTAPHLHFELLRRGRSVDPAGWLTEGG
jgi:murein DD-endopeptidase MepM/ murein hydrolase activator NlpD